MTDPAIIAHLREHVAAQAEALDILQAARRAPIEVRLMEYVLGISAGVAIACLIAMLAQGFTLHDGAHVPPLLPSIDFTSLSDWWPWRRGA